MKKLLKKTTAVLLTLILTLSIAACDSSGSISENLSENDQNLSESANISENTTDEADVIRIGYVATVVDPFITLEEKLNQMETVFSERGVKVEFYEFSIGVELLEALGAGEIDVSSTTGDTPIMTSVSNGYPVQCIFIAQEDPDGNALIVSPDSGINTVADLKGHKVGITIGSSSHDILLRVLETENLTEKDVELVNLGVAEGESAITNGSIDALVGAYPSIGSVIESTGSVKLDIPKVKRPVSFVSGNTDFMTANPTLTQTYLEVLYSYTDYIQANRDEIFELLKEKYEVDDSYRDIVNRWTFTPIADEELKADFEKTEEFLESQDLIENSFTVDDFYTDKYAQQAKESYKNIEK